MPPRGLKLAVASSADRMKVEGNLRALKLPPDTFHALVVGEDVTHKKPAPDIFLEAARRLGLDPSACLVIEDAVSGVAAAKAAGCRCLGITTSFTPRTAYRSRSRVDGAESGDCARSGAYLVSPMCPARSSVPGTSRGRNERIPDCPFIDGGHRPSGHAVAWRSGAPERASMSLTRRGGLGLLKRRVWPGLRAARIDRTARGHSHDGPVTVFVLLPEVGHHRPHVVPVRPRVRFPRRPHLLQHAVLIHRLAPGPATPPAYRSAAARISIPDRPSRSAVEASRWRCGYSSR